MIRWIYSNLLCLIDSYLWFESEKRPDPLILFICFCWTCPNLLSFLIFFSWFLVTLRIFKLYLQHLLDLCTRIWQFGKYKNRQNWVSIFFNLNKVQWIIGLVFSRFKCTNLPDKFETKLNSPHWNGFVWKFKSKQMCLFVDLYSNTILEPCFRCCLLA